jgi:segregation and condensation protein B
LVAPKQSIRPGVASAQVARLARLEAVLFLAKEALSARRLGQLANLADGTEARTLLGELSRKYDQRGSSFQVEQVAEGYRLLVRPQFAPWVRQLTGGENDWKLSPPALDTLTVVAYRQPVLRSEVEAIRGVGSGELLRQLIERDLLRIVGRSSELGRPLLYGTTKRFLQTFGLKSLDDLPMASELRRGSNALSPADGERLTTTSSKAA